MTDPGPDLGSSRGSFEIPPQTRALLLHVHGDLSSLVSARRPLGAPGPEQVLVRVAASPVNPSDLAFLAGTYGLQKPLPAVPGFEASGTVVRAGDSAEARALLGRRVACFADGGDGTWAEYAMCAARSCVPLLDGVDLEAAACMMVNPTTAWALLDFAGEGGHGVVLQTAAASALGQMLTRLGQRRGVRFIHVIRRAAQREVVREAGGEHILDESEPDFEGQLGALTRSLKVRLAFDAVGGPMTGRLVRLLPTGSRVVVYGALSGEVCAVSSLDLIFGEKSVEGFWLARWLRKQGPEELLAVRAGVQQRLSDDLRTQIAERVSLSDAPLAIRRKAAGITAGKILLLP